jgi:hypothetical protein
MGIIMMRRDGRAVLPDIIMERGGNAEQQRPPRFVSAVFLFIHFVVYWPTKKNSAKTTPLTERAKAAGTYARITVEDEATAVPTQRVTVCAGMVVFHCCFPDVAGLLSPGRVAFRTGRSISSDQSATTFSTSSSTSSSSNSIASFDGFPHSGFSLFRHGDSFVACSRTLGGRHCRYRASPPMCTFENVAVTG